MALKQVIVVRSDLEMGKGKLAAQVAHASLMSYFAAAKQDSELTEQWLAEGEKKIVLKVDGEEALKKLYAAFQYLHVPCALVEDAGLTELPPGTVTALGIGPWRSEDIDKLTGSLKLL
ncbi:MAG: peptidyl-tRNA hydrolase Pth2 [Candidatus Micrarchaeia archaeon]